MSTLEEIEFTSCQEEGYKNIIKWSNSPRINDEDYFCTLAGPAGSGKSTLAKFILDSIKKRKRIAVTAPTHKAKKVIGDFTGMKAETIQALLGLRPNIDLADFDPNKPVFDTKAEEKLRNYDVVLIDEGSMLNEEAFDLIQEKAIQYGCDILFMGDIYQLPPVGEVRSKIFSVKYVFILETVVRQKQGSPNQELLLLAREDVKLVGNKTQNYINSVVQDVNEKGGFKLLGKEEFYKEVLEYFYDSEYKYNRDYIKILCYRNATVKRINKFIRKKINPSDELVAPTDLLMGYNSVTKQTFMQGSTFYENVIENSRDYEVDSVDIEEKTILGTTYLGYKTKFKGIKIPVFILHRDSYSEFVDEFNDRLKKAKQFRRWRSFYDFKEQILLMEDVFDNYGNFVCKKDLDYGYAITVHKSQGSTYDNVGVILKDINVNGDALELRKLLYVALSRARNYNFIYNG